MPSTRFLAPGPLSGLYVVLILNGKAASPSTGERLSVTQPSIDRLAERWQRVPFKVANSFDALYSQPMNTSALSPITTTTKKQVLSMTIIGIEIMRLPAGPGGD